MQLDLQGRALDTHKAGYLGDIELGRNYAE